MVHLNELHEKYHAKGLIILGVANEARSAVDAFVTSTEAKYPFLIESSDTRSIYEVKSIPSAVLIGPSGRILWTGHPGNLTEASIEEHLAGVRLLPDLSGPLAAVGKALAKDQFASARSKAEKSTTHKDEETAAAATAVCEWIDWFGTATLEGAAKDLEAGRFYEAWLGFDLIASGYKGLDIAKEAEAQADAITDDKERKKAVEAGQKYDKLMLEIADLSAKKAVRKLEPYVKKYEGTPHGDRAAAKLATLDKDD